MDIQQVSFLFECLFLLAKNVQNHISTMHCK
nr:MAG TPA: hypothetical protein [Caudoviricetes sp.]